MWAASKVTNYVAENKPTTLTKLACVYQISLCSHAPTKGKAKALPINRELEWYKSIPYLR